MKHSFKVISLSTATNGTVKAVCQELDQYPDEMSEEGKAFEPCIIIFSIPNVADTPIPLTVDAFFSIELSF